MKHWPTTRTDFRYVTPSALQFWNKAKRDIAICARLKAWLAKQGDYPDGQVKYDQDMARARREAEVMRLVCRRQDIEGRWTMRQFERRHRVRKPAVKTGWQPTPMGYDQRHNQYGQLVEA